MVVAEHWPVLTVHAEQCNHTFRERFEPTASAGTPTLHLILYAVMSSSLHATLIGVEISDDIALQPRICCDKLPMLNSFSQSRIIGQICLSDHFGSLQANMPLHAVPPDVPLQLWPDRGGDVTRRARSVAGRTGPGGPAAGGVDGGIGGAAGTAGELQDAQAWAG